MLISQERRFVFVHIPKTGGVSVRQFLLDNTPDAVVLEDRHVGLRHALREHPETLDFYAFGFVRNPWKRLVSWYSMIDEWNREWGPASGKPQGGHGSVRDGNKFWRTVAGYSGFDEFIMRGLDELPRLARPQLDYLTANRRSVDFIGRTEHLGRDLGVVARHLGIDYVEAPHRNRSSHGSHVDYYSDAARAKVAEAYAVDIAEFGYRFDD